jgi:integrase
MKRKPLTKCCDCGRPVKFASAHDLRRSLLDRLVDMDLPPLIVSRVARHASFETTRRHYAKGDIQKDAAKIRRLLAVASPAQHTADDARLDETAEAEAS